MTPDSLATWADDALAEQPGLHGAEYAGFWIRLCAGVVDVVCAYLLTGLLYVPTVLVLYVASETRLLELPERAGEGLGLFLVLLYLALVTWSYFTVLESSKAQATWGKRLLGLRVTDPEGQRIGFLRANIRYWSKLPFFFFFFAFLIVAFHPRKRGLHDMIANTLVLRRW
jgi:uncharacterized RDD family membrane protein YckC